MIAQKEKTGYLRLCHQCDDQRFAPSIAGAHTVRQTWVARTRPAMMLGESSV